MTAEPTPADWMRLLDRAVNALSDLGYGSGVGGPGALEGLTMALTEWLPSGDGRSAPGRTVVEALDGIAESIGDLADAVRARPPAE
jgi:hypothetical protein